MYFGRHLIFKYIHHKNKVKISRNGVFQVIKCIICCFYSHITNCKRSSPQTLKSDSEVALLVPLHLSETILSGVYINSLSKVFHLFYDSDYIYNQRIALQNTVLQKYSYLRRSDYICSIY